MAIRIPRGFAVNRPYFLELCEGVRPTAEATPLKAWTGLPAVRIDEVHHDPIVIDAGTVIGIVASGTASGYVVPAVRFQNASGELGGDLLYTIPHSDSATWGLPTTSGALTVGTVKPIGVVYQPIYSFYLETHFTNYKRVHSVGYVTDYVINVPAITKDEAEIKPGDLVVIGPGRKTGTQDSTWNNASFYNGGPSKPAGRYAAFDSAVTGHEEIIVGRCLKKLTIGTTADATPIGKQLKDCTTFTISTAATAEFKNLSKVQTVPGLGLTGSGTNGIPGHLMGARADAGGNFYALTILIRL